MAIKGYSKLLRSTELEPRHQIRFSIICKMFLFFWDGGGGLILLQRIQSTHYSKLSQQNWPKKKKKKKKGLMITVLSNHPLQLWIQTKLSQQRRTLKKLPKLKCLPPPSNIGQLKRIHSCMKQSLTASLNGNWANWTTRLNLSPSLLTSRIASSQWTF